MDKPHTTPKDFFLWVGAMVSFYWSAIAFILLIFNYVDYAFPDVLNGYAVNPYQTGISYQMASIIILLPVSLLLMRAIRTDIVRDPIRKDIWVRRWAIIFTLFVAGATVIGDLIALLTTFLNGEELTASFLLKAATVLLVAGGVFLHFIAELRGYWERNPAYRGMVQSGVAMIAIVSIASGFLIVGTPKQARLYRFDTQKVNDLQTMQMRIINYWQAKQSLPNALLDLTDSLSYGPIPTDPQSGEEYGYETTGVRSFKLCAKFNSPSSGTTDMMPRSELYAAKVGSSDEWKHEAGEVCFDRTIDPSFYPPLSD